MENEDFCDGCCYCITCDHDIEKCCYLVQNECLVKNKVGE